MKKENVSSQRQGAVLVIRIDRPEALNAIDRATATQLHRALDLLESDESLRVGILTGTGRAFCAGSDLKEIASAPSYVDGLASGNVSSVVRRELSAPLIAAVNGLAYGGGMEIVLACDLAVAAPTATFALPEAEQGLLAGAGGLLRGPRQLPMKVVLDLALTCEPITAEQALGWGLLSRISDDPLAEAVAMGHRIASFPAAAVTTSKAVVHQGLDAPLSGSDSAWDRVEPAVLAVLRNR